MTLSEQWKPKLDATGKLANDEWRRILPEVKRRRRWIAASSVAGTIATAAFFDQLSVGQRPGFVTTGEVIATGIAALIFWGILTLIALNLSNLRTGHKVLLADLKATFDASVAAGCVWTSPIYKDGLLYTKESDNLIQQRLGNRDHVYGPVPTGERRPSRWQDWTIQTTWRSWF